MVGAGPHHRYKNSLISIPIFCATKGDVTPFNNYQGGKKTTSAPYFFLSSSVVFFAHQRDVAGQRKGDRRTTGLDYLIQRNR
jgi:hypothetical protein